MRTIFTTLAFTFILFAGLNAFAVSEVSPREPGVGDPGSIGREPLFPREP